MITTPSPTSVALLLGLSFFLGLAYEDFFSRGEQRRPGGIRTFPMLALGGGILYLLDPVHFIPFTVGLIVLGSWLFVYYRAQVAKQDEEEEPGIGLVVPLLNVHAYLLGAVALALPPWFAVTVTVAAVLLLTGREQLHNLARRLEMKEIVTAGEFLILTGIVLPLLPDHPVTDLTAITPRRAWLALLVVCTFSYASYLAQRYWPRAAGGLWMAALGGLYSSTATTVVLAREAAEPAAARQARAGITLATAIMYLRILAVIGVFNFTLARQLLVPLCGLAAVGLIICAVQYWRAEPDADGSKARTMVAPVTRNPLELGPAVIFALFFVVISVVTAAATARFGAAGIYALAAIVGVSDIDPFVLNLAEGGTANLPDAALVAAVLIAASSNNILKALYAVFFSGGKATAGSAGALVFLAAAGIATALLGIAL